MARILGWLGTNLPAADRLESQLDRHAPIVDSSRVVGTGFVAALSGHATERSTAAADGISVAVLGSPRLRDAGASSAAAIAERFSQIGTALLDQLSGAFALAVFDTKRQRGLIAIDRMGIHPLFVLPAREGVFFGSAPNAIVTLADQQRRISPQAVFDYLFCHVVPAPRSICEGPVRLLPGECIEFADGDAVRKRYWQAKFVEVNDASFADLREQFLQSLRASVGEAMRGARCGAFLSGGTDSSTIAGLMTQLGGEPARTFSIGFDAAGFDELEYARLASRHFGTDHHEYYVTPRDIVDALPALAATHTQPFGNSSALPTYFCARLAEEHGVERLLGGDGGDELFGGNARYAKQRVFSRYEILPAALRRSVLEPMCAALARRGRPPVLSKVVSYVEQASVPMPERLESYNLLQRIGAGRILTDEFRAQIDPCDPIRLNEEAYLNPSAQSLINRMLALDFKTTLADNDLPKVMQSCELAGLPVAFPMLDERVVDFSLSLPPELKLKGTRLRYFFKEALRGFLPDAIITKTKHGFGLPFGEWAVKHRALRELVFDALESVKQRRWIRPEFIDELRDELLPAHPNYYGTMAWVLMMLELWLQHHSDAAQDLSATS